MFRDNVFETSDTTGTGTLTLAGAVTGARTYRTAFGDGPVTAAYVMRSAVEDGEFEVGIGTFEFTGGNSTLARDTVLSSSNSDAAVNWGAGTRNVWCAPSGETLGGLLEGGIGSSRPGWLQAGGSWVDIVSATVWNWYLYDGTDDILTGTFDPTGNTWTAKGTRWAFGTAIDDDDIDGSNILTLPTDGVAFAFTGTQQVDAIATVGAGTEIELHHGSARVLTHDGDDIDLPGGASITTADGDVSRWREYATGKWRCTVYTPAAGGAVGGLAQGTHTIFVPAGAMKPTVSNGCAALASAETTAGRPDDVTLNFDASADEHAQFQIAMPKSWDGGTIGFEVFHKTTATDTDGVAWALQAVSVGDGETSDVAYGTAAVVTDAYQSNADFLYRTGTGTVTVAGGGAAGDMTYFRIFRDVSDAADTAAEDAMLVGVLMTFTIDARNDA